MKLIEFVKAVRAWWREPEPQEAYDGLCDGSCLVCSARKPEGGSPGHEALWDIPAKPNSLRRFAFKYATPRGDVTSFPGEPYQPLYFDQAYEDQPPWRVVDGESLYL